MTGHINDVHMKREKQIFGALKSHIADNIFHRMCPTEVYRTQKQRPHKKGTRVQLKW